MRILLIEDDKKIAEFISRGLTEASFSVDHVDNGTEGLQLALTDSYDIGIFDIMLPGLSGLEVLERIRRTGVSFPVLILSAKQSVEDRVRGLQIGADDYLTKPFSFAELLARVQALTRRGKVSSEKSMYSASDLTMNLVSREVERAGIRFDLQPREFALLKLFMENQGMVLSKVMILEKIWGYNFDPQTNAVDVLVCRLRNKVDKDFEQKLIHTIRGVGYVFRQE